MLDVNLPRLLTSTEAAKLLRVSERTLRDLRKHGLIRYVAVTDRKIMYRPQDCEAFIESRTRQAEARPQATRGVAARPRSGRIVPFSEIIARGDKRRPSGKA